MPDTVRFLASIAATETAISYTGNGDGQRIKLDIPETQLGNAAGLLALRRRMLRVTIEDLGAIEDYQGAAISEGAPGLPGPIDRAFGEDDGEPPEPRTYF